MDEADDWLALPVAYTLSSNYRRRIIAIFTSPTTDNRRTTTTTLQAGEEEEAREIGKSCLASGTLAPDEYYAPRHVLSHLPARMRVRGQPAETADRLRV